MQYFFFLNLYLKMAHNYNSKTFLVLSQCFLLLMCHVMALNSWPQPDLTQNISDANINGRKRFKEAPDAPKIAWYLYTIPRDNVEKEELKLTQQTSISFQATWRQQGVSTYLGGKSFLKLCNSLKAILRIGIENISWKHHREAAKQGGIWITFHEWPTHAQIKINGS